MAFAETAKLAVDLSLKGNLSSGLSKVEGQLGKLQSHVGKVGQGFGTIGRGLGVAFKNSALLAGVAVGGLTALLAQSVKEGQDAAKVQTIYATAIANSGKVSAQYVGILNAQQTALMNLGGIDDELIKTEQSRLIQMGLTGAQVAKLTPLILDMSKATGRDLLTTTLAVGKAVNGNVGGLQRYGVVIDKTKAKTDAFGAVQDALNKKFGGTTQALSGSLEARLGALRENLANIREEAGMKLLPAITRIVDVAGKDLVPAFGKFVDRILPSVISGVDKFASLLENGGAERGIQAITDALGPMVEMLKIAAAPVKLIVDAFLKLPSQVQGVLIGAFAINKLSGGLIGQGVGQVLKGALGGVLGGLVQRGGTPANPVFVADVAGGLGGKLPVPPISPLGFLAPGLGMAAAMAIAPFIMFDLIPMLTRQATPPPTIKGPAGTFAPGTSTTNMLLAGNPNLYNLAAQAGRTMSSRTIGDYGAPHPGSLNAGTRAVPPADTQAGRRNVELYAILKRGLGAGFRPSQKALEATYQRNIERATKAAADQSRRTAEAARATTQAVKDGDSSIVAAIHGIRPPVVNVSVTASDITRVVTQRRRAVVNRNPRTALQSGPLQFG